MQAVILAGGLGTRLRPLTYSTPKPLIPIKGKPFLDYLIEMLKGRGISNIVICSCYLADKMKERYKRDKEFGIKIRHSIESTPLGTAGAVKNAAFYLEDVFFVINGDTYLDMDYADMYEKFLQADRLAMMVVYTGKEKLDRINDTLIEGDKVLSYSKDGENKNSGHVFAGVLLMRKSALDYIARGKTVTLEKEVFPKLIEKGELLAYETKVRYYDIGTVERMKKFEEFISRMDEEEELE